MRRIARQREESVMGPWAASGERSSGVAVTQKAARLGRFLVGADESNAGSETSWRCRLSEPSMLAFEIPLIFDIALQIGVEPFEPSACILVEPCGVQPPTSREQSFKLLTTDAHPRLAGNVSPSKCGKTLRETYRTKKGGSD
jgi:hypothetical protein